MKISARKKNPPLLNKIARFKREIVYLEDCLQRKKSELETAEKLLKTSGPEVDVRKFT